MSPVSVMRFIILGAAGFGLGAVVAGGNSLLSYFTMGMLGGVALAVPFKDWRKAVILGLAGLAGFGIGFTVWFFVLFTFVPDFGSFHEGLIGGAIGGAMLGATFRSWRSVTVLALAGALGFGIGGGVFDVLSQPLVEPGASGVTFWWAVLFMAIRGIIGGASLGAALGYLENRRLTAELEPRVR